MTDLLPYIIFIDSCAIYPPQQAEKEAMNKLFELDKEGKICLEIGLATEQELKKAPPKIKARIDNRMCSSDTIIDEKDRRIFEEIKTLLFPAKRILDRSDIKDARSIFCAQSWYASMFVTVDKKHILSKAHFVKQKFGMSVVYPTQCLKVVLDKIQGIKNVTIREVPLKEV